jgi:putative transposase
LPDHALNHKGYSVGSSGREVIARSKSVGPRAPNLNAFAERWVESIKTECLDHFIVFGEGHLRYLISEYLVHFLDERPHQSKDNLPLAGILPAKWEEGISSTQVECRERLGGLLKHYSRQAA